MEMENAGSGGKMLQWFKIDLIVWKSDEAILGVSLITGLK